MKGTTLLAMPKDPGGSTLTKVKSLVELLFQEKARPRGVDLIAAGKCPRGGVSPVACMFCGEGHLLNCHAGQTCEEAKCSHYLQEAEEGETDEIRHLLVLEREARA
jgi:hypothetical protein